VSGNDFRPFKEASIKMESQDYYQVLGVTRDAEEKAIKEAYRELALKYHPDRNQDNPEAVERMKAVNEAYAVLSHPDKRRAYNAMRQEFGASAHRQFRQQYSDQDIFAGSDILRIFEEMTRAHGFRRSEDILREFYGPGYRAFKGRRAGMQFRGFVFTGRGAGGGRRLARHHPSGGRGVGRLARHLIERLTGVVLPEVGQDAQDTIRLSPEKARQGGPYAFFYRKQKKKLVVKIPPGIRQGQRIRLAGLGGAGRGGGPPGDLYLRVEIEQPFLARWRDRVKRWLP
jgi:curved DNA-binding protein CbpA